LENLEESTTEDLTNELDEDKDVGGTIPSILILLTLVPSRLLQRLFNSNLTVCLKS
jgi:hypothetical protein